MSDSGDFRGRSNEGRGDGRPGDGRPGDGRPGDGRPTRPDGQRPPTGRPKDARPPRASDRKPGERPTPDRSAGNRSERQGETEKRLWTKGGAPARGDSSAREREVPEDRDPFNIRSVRTRHDDPEIPEGVKDSDLDRIARNELKTLAKDNAEGVAQHLVMAARLIEDDPELAHRHALSAARRAGRIGVVRETLAITAYATGDFALALRELRTYRRITGRDDQLPMMVDSERGVGRPEKALELGRSVPKSTLPVPVQVELAIAMSGARLDLGQPEAALVELEIPQLDASTAFSYSPALFESYASVLEELGRAEEAEEWYARADAAAEALERAELPEGDDTVEVYEEELELTDDADRVEPVETPEHSETESTKNAGQVND